MELLVHMLRASRLIHLLRDAMLVPEVLGYRRAMVESYPALGISASRPGMSI